MIRQKTPGSNDALLRMTADVVTAYVGNNTVTPSDLADVIRTVHASLQQAQASESSVAAAPKPAVPVKKSITPDYLICLEDGRELKMLKRHLRTTYNLTPDEYRAKWGLDPTTRWSRPTMRGDGRSSRSRSASARRDGGPGQSRATSALGTAARHLREAVPSNRVPQKPVG